MFTSQFNWTDEQWDAYYKKTVTIGLDWLESLATAVELLAKGSRLTKEERRQWETTVKSCNEILDKEAASINKMAKGDTDD